MRRDKGWRVYMHAPWSLLGATKTKTISSCHAKTNATASEIIHLDKCKIFYPI